MLDVKNSNRSHPSLLPLRMALIVAESGVPASSPRQLTNDERCASNLIEKMKTEYNTPLPFQLFVQQTPKSDAGFEFKLQAWEVIEANV